MDRNVQIGYLLADEIHGQLPPLQKDLFWGQTNPLLPHTKASIQKRDKVFAGHLAHFKLKGDESDIVTFEEMTEQDAENAENAPFLKFSKLIRSMKKQGEDGEQPSDHEAAGTSPPKITAVVIPKTHGPPFDTKMSLYIDDSS